MQKKTIFISIFFFSQVKDGKLYFKMPGKWKQARATFFEPFDLNSPEKEPQPEEPNFLPAELKTIIKQPPSSSSSSISCSSSNVCTGASSMIDPSKSVPYSTHCSVKSTFNTIEVIRKNFYQLLFCILHFFFEMIFYAKFFHIFSFD